MNDPLNIAIIGGGAAGFFTALNIPNEHHISIFEETRNYLRKVKISGGGRCNVTHHQFEINKFIKNYPRGEKELISPLHQFQASDTIEWFEKRGVEIKVEQDGRMFPKSNSSQTIIDCFLKEAAQRGISLNQIKVTQISKEKNKFILKFSNDNTLEFDRILIATGSSKSGYELAKGLGHKITELAPSLFSFKIKHPLLKEMAGTSFKNVSLKLKLNKKIFSQSGDLLITHWGLSGPAILKLSAWAAREFKNTNYRGTLFVNFNSNDIDGLKKQSSKKQIKNSKPQIFTNKFWIRVLDFLQIDSNKNWADISKKELQNIKVVCEELELEIQGQNRFKEEFVECGGINLKEINFKTMESKITPGLFFAGEILDIDGITGGFNFQNAWTTGYIVSKNIAN